MGVINQLITGGAPPCTSPVHLDRHVKLAP